ncbi:hypothetical protein [Microbacterium murale]|uniref:Uncharacterized protein n=1 Tax=Microbacterium murale TaxID=1081040 RepID=A0ABU0PB38_9MICO|nr:hypothetical protein [Microbacterium murale]MDQ0643901.1 hypothetical protein [Microbacterium murale]
MYEHPSYTHARVTGEQARAARELERRRSMLDHPSRIVRRERPLIALLKRAFRGEKGAPRSARAAASSSTPSDKPRVVCEQPAQPAHAR